MKNEKVYFVNNKQVNKEIFDYYLIKVSKAIAITEDYYTIEDFREIYSDFMERLENGYILEVMRIKFKIDIK